MATLRMSDIPLAYAGTGALRRLKHLPLGERYEPSGLGRRGFLQGVAAVGTATALSVMSWFPAVRKAHATHQTWTEYEGCAGQGDYDGTCQNPCVGVGVDNMGPEFCTQCDETPLEHGVWGWHFDGYRPRPQSQAAVELRDLWSNICSGSSGPRDAWSWEVQPCNVTDPQTGQTITCNPMRIRCHDGRKRPVNPTGDWQVTICEGFRECGSLTGRSIMCS